MSAMVFAALRNIGKANVTTGRVAHLQRLLRQEDRRRLLRDLPMATGWMHPFIRYIAGKK